MFGGDIFRRSNGRAVGVINTDNDIDQIRVIDLFPHPASGDSYEINIIFFDQPDFGTGLGNIHPFGFPISIDGLFNAFGPGA